MTIHRLVAVMQDLMERRMFSLMIFLLAFAPPSFARELNFESYLKTFDVTERAAMKISVQEALELYKNGKAVFLDIRFPEETQLISFNLAKTIPLNELPKRLNELDKAKVIIPFCPHSDRSGIARTFLTLKGFKSRYLVEGLPGLVDQLRGDKAKQFSDAIQGSAK